MFKVTFSGESSEFNATFNSPESVAVGFDKHIEVHVADYYEGSYEVTPGESTQTLNTQGLVAQENIVVKPIPDQYIVPAGEKSITANGEHDVAQYAAVNVDVPIPPGYIVPAGSQTVTDNDTYDVTELAQVVVNVPAPTVELQSKTATPTESAQTIKADDGYDGMDKVVVNAVPGDYVGSSIPRKASANLTASGSTVTAPAGYYAEDATKTLDSATWKSASTVGVVPEISVNSDGLITANCSGWTSIHPLTASGYADSSHSADIQLAGVRTLQLTTVGATTYTPNKTAPQIIQAGQYLTGDQTIDVIPAQYYDMGGDLAWLGKGAELVGENFYKKVDTLDNTLYNGWTPSTTAKAIVATATLSDAKFTASDIDQYAYYIIWECGVDIAYTGSPTLKALPVFGRALIVQNLIKRPSSFVNIQSETCDATVNQAALTSSFLRYYGTTTGSITYTWAASYGLYFTATAPTISSASAVSPTITPKTPAFNARTSTTYMSATSANAIDQENTKWWIKGTKIYRVKRECFFDGIYRYMCGVINSSAPT